jgi:hypothetical protein
MDSRSVLQIALFGVKGGIAWVADDVFVTRSGVDVLVERWIGPRLVAVVVQQQRTGVMQAIWAKLNEVAVDVGWPIDAPANDF